MFDRNAAARWALLTLLIGFCISLRVGNTNSLLFLIACFTRAESTPIRSSVSGIVRRAAFVFPKGLKIVRSLKSMFSVFIRNTSSGRIPVCNMHVATSRSGWLASERYAACSSNDRT